MNRHAKGKVQQGSPAEQRNVDLTLERPGKRGKSRTFQNHGAHIGMIIKKRGTGGHKILLRLFIVGARGGGPVVLTPQMLELRAVIVVFSPGDNIIAVDFDVHGSQMGIVEIFFFCRQNAHDFFGPHELLSPGNLQKAGHEHRHIHMAGNLFLKIGKVTALGGNGPAPHLF